MVGSRPEPVLRMQNGGIDKWRRRIVVQTFFAAALLILVVEGFLLLVVAVSRSGSVLIEGGVGLPILILIVAFIEVKWMQFRTLDVLTNYEYHWTYRPDELQAFAQLVRRENRKRTFGRGIRITPRPELRRGMAHDIFISRTHLYEIGGRVVPLKVPLNQFTPVFGDQFTTLQYEWERRYWGGEEGWQKDTGEIWILVPGGEVDQFSPDATRGVAALKGMELPPC